MTTTSSAPGVETPDRDMRPVYAGVILVEVLVLLGIWLFQRYFGT
jgi:hypothetical protein